MLYYVVSSNTSWCNVGEAIIAGPYANRQEALDNCPPGDWVKYLTGDQAEALTY